MFIDEVYDKNFDNYLHNLSEDEIDPNICDLRDTMAKFILPRLKEFYKYDARIPCTIYEFEFMSQEYAYDRWKDIQLEIIQAFELLVDYDCMNCKDSIKDAKIKKGLKLFAKYFESYWC